MTSLSIFIYHIITYIIDIINYYNLYFTPLLMFYLSLYLLYYILVKLY